MYSISNESKAQEHMAYELYRAKRVSVISIILAGI